MGQAIKVAKPITRKVEVADHLSIHTCEGEDAMETYTYDVRMFKETFEYGFTYINGFMRNVHRFAHRPAVTCPLRNRTWTYAELNREVNRLAHALLGDGIGKNDVVMYQLLNSFEFVLSYLAPQKIGVLNC